MTPPKQPHPKTQPSGAHVTPPPPLSTPTPPSPDQQKELERKLAEQFADGENVEPDPDDLWNNVLTDEERLASKKDKEKDKDQS